MYKKEAKKEWPSLEGFKSQEKTIDIIYKKVCA